MSNDKFDDIGVLKTLQELREAKLLHPNDAKALVKQLKSDWGKSTAKDLLAGNVDDDSRSVLRKYSSAF